MARPVQNEHSRPAPRSQATRAAILEAAAEVFAERGYEGAAVSDIARRAGYTTGAIYGCFRDKAELLLEVIRSALSDQQVAAARAGWPVAGGSGPVPPVTSADGAGADRAGSDRAGSDRAGAASFEELASALIGPEEAGARALVLEAHVAARRDPAVRSLLQAAQAERLATLAGLVGEAQRAGQVRHDVDVQAVAVLLMAVPLGLVLLDAAGVAFPPAADFAVLAQAAAESVRPAGRPGRRRRN